MGVKKLGVIGCGNMGSAIIESIAANKGITARPIYIFDRIKGKKNKLAARYNIQPQFSNTEVVKKSDIIIIAVKPQDSDKLLKEVGLYIDRSKLVVSVMAGIKMAKISRLTQDAVPIARVMPNMAAFVGEAVSGISYNKYVSSGQKRIVRELFKGIGKVYEIKEVMQDAITALTGSGPAYFLYLVEAFVDAACKLGFSRRDALALVSQTMKGSARLLEDLRISPEELRRKVTSKGGTTEAAVKILDKRAIKRIILDAVLAARKRSRELSS